MKIEELQKGIKYLKNIKLSKEEKESILNVVLNTPVESPYTYKNLWHNFLIQKRMSYTFATLFALVSFGGILFYQAEFSLPGQKLYLLNVGVTEPMRDFVNFTPEKRAEWESVKTVRRLEEALDLTAQGALNEDNRSQIEERFNKHLEVFDENIKIASSTKKLDLIEIEFEANIDAKAKVFEDFEKKIEYEDDSKKDEKKSENKGESSKNVPKFEKREDEDRGKEEFKKLKESVFEKIENRKKSK